MIQRFKRLPFIVSSIFFALSVGATIALAMSNQETVGGKPVERISALADERISAAASAPSGEDVLDPTTASMVQSLNARFGGNERVGLRLPGEARMLPGTVNGKRVYIIPTDKGALCVLVEADSEVCGPSVSAAQPVRVTVVDAGSQGGVRPTVFGIAIDGVSAISFTLGGAQVSVPVNDNLFVFHGNAGMTANDFLSPSVTFSDGKTVRLP